MPLKSCIRALPALGVPLVAGALLVAGLPATAATAAEAPRPIVSGWLPYWSTARSIATLTANADLMREVSPFWYTVRWTGSTGVTSANVSTSNKFALKKAAAAAGVPLWPSFTDSMPSRRLSWVMRDMAQRKALISRMVSLAVAEGYAGLDLDFEKFAFSDGSSTWSTTRPGWVAFVRDLSAALHARGKKLAVTTPPLCNQAGVCGPDRGYWVYDWAGVGRYADVLRIMAYDYSWTVPGPIGPWAWTEAIARYATSVVPAAKVEIGVPTYGRDWTRRDANNKYLVTGTCPSNVPSGYLSKHTFDTVDLPAVLASRGLTRANISWSAKHRESYIRYSRTYASGTRKCTVYRELWFGDARSAAARATLVGTYKIGGIVTWTIGGEDPAQWARLRSYAGTIAPNTAALGVSAPTTAAYRAPITVSVSLQSSGKAVAAAPVRLYWRAGTRGTWYLLGTVTTDAAGRGTTTLPSPGGGYLLATASGSWGRQRVSTVRKILLRQVVSPATTRSASRIAVRVSPRVTGQRVVVQRLLRGSWRVLAPARVSSRGVAYLDVPRVASARVYRFVAVRTATSVTVASAPIHK